MDFTKALTDLAAVVGKSDTSQSIPYHLSSGLPNVNMAVSGDPDLGFPGGRIITLAGPESCGKTALATVLMAEAQRRGGFAFFEDFEHSFAHAHAARVGLKCDPSDGNWHYKKPAHAEEGFARVYQIIHMIRALELGVALPKNSKEKPTAEFDAFRAALHGKDLAKLIPICGTMDSVASMIPRSQDVDFAQQNMKTKNMDHAAMLSLELKRLARDADIAGVTMILLNQLRTNPGVMFGDNSTEPGGNAPKFYASVMIRLRRVDKWYASYGDKKSEVLGDVVELFTRKNKTYRPFKKTKYVFRTADPVGLDLFGTMLLLGKEAGVLGPVAGTTVEFDGKKKWSIADFEASCRSDPALLKRLVDHVMTHTNPVDDGPVVEDDEPGAGGIPVVAPGGVASVLGDLG